MHRKITLLLVTALLALKTASAQSPTPEEDSTPKEEPTPMVVEAASSDKPKAPSAVQNLTMDGPASVVAALRALQVLQAVNDDILKKQAATLQKLDELEKAAEQLKIYSKRG